MQESRPYFRQAYDYFLSRLLDGTLGPGDLVDRNQASADLGCSLAPVNQAITRLEVEGFLDTAARRGTRVRILKPDEVRGQYLLRQAIECEAARQYCGAPVRARREELEAMVRPMDGEKCRSAELLRTDVNLHRALVALAACPVLTRHFDRVGMMQLFFSAPQFLAMLPSWRPGDGREFVEVHLMLIDQLCDPDPLAADSAIRAHIARGKGSLLLPIGDSASLAVR